MINILLPAMGNSTFFKDYYFPKLVLEVNGKTILEKVIENFSGIDGRRFVFVLNQSECTKFHIDDSIKVFVKCENSIIMLKNQTGGALCTCLLAVDKINSETPLLIANCDQVIDIDYNMVIKYFSEREVDAGVITFPSIHPRWSYVRMEEENIVEVAEKRPISGHAIAGVYYYRHGSDFVEAAKKAILKKNSFEGKYYISSSLNELILMNKRLGAFEVKKQVYHSFYSPEKIKEYEKGAGNR